MNLIIKMLRRVFKGIQRHQLGLAYNILCFNFALVEIKSKTQHKAAIKVINRLIDFLNDEPTGIKQIRSDVESYLNTLSCLVEMYEFKTYFLA